GSLPDKISDIKYDNGNENRNPQKKTENILDIQAFFWKRKYMVNNLSSGQNNASPKAGTVALP
ncbi:MAG: hypothetical protein II263_07865, partial [Lachnospiraceae bacterium]|nr:hypothetical protein [Lachnospiraceae bacterium]